MAFCGIDGKLFFFNQELRFQNPPKDDEPKAQHYWNHKKGYSLNAMIVGDGRYFRLAPTSQKKPPLE